MIHPGNENSRVWTVYWADATKTNRGRGPMNSGFWNAMAGRYTRNQDPAREKARMERILGLIEGTGIKLDGADVLDIGAGTGSLSIPLAKRGAQVTAVDFSEGMLDRFIDRARREQVTGIRTILKPWDAIDPDAEGFRNRFDLVIASMTPAVRTPDDFRKMLETAKGICYYSGWVNRNWDPAILELYREIFDDEFREGTHGFSLPFTYLYLLGYRPDVILHEDEWEREETIDEIVQTVSGFFSVNREIDNTVRGKIREFFSSRTGGNTVSTKTSVITGMMVWDMRVRADHAGVRDCR